MAKAEEYLKQNVKGILQPMVKEILSSRPKDPVNKKIYLNKYNYFFNFQILFMINWLQKNYHLKQESTSSQKLELEKLRQQVQEYRKKYNEGDKEMEV